MASQGDVRPDEVERALKLAYLYGERDRTRKLLDDLLTLSGHLDDRKMEVSALLQVAADMVHKSLWIREVTIGLRSPSDGLYRYEVMSGLRDDAWKAHADIHYTYEEFNDQNAFKGRWISERTKLFLAEDRPYLDGEDETFNRPILLEARRRSVDDCIEGDYLDTHILDEKGELIGWIEISGTRDGKFPDGNAIRWIEVIATMLGIVLKRVLDKGNRHPLKGLKTSRAR